MSIFSPPNGSNEAPDGMMFPDGAIDSTGRTLKPAVLLGLAGRDTTSYPHG